MINGEDMLVSVISRKPVVVLPGTGSSGASTPKAVSYRELNLQCEAITKEFIKGYRQTERHKTVLPMKDR